MNARLLSGVLLGVAFLQWRPTPSKVAPRISQICVQCASEPPRGISCPPSVSLEERIVLRVTRIAGAKMPFTFSKVNAVIRAVRMSRQRGLRQMPPTARKPSSSQS